MLRLLHGPLLKEHQHDLIRSCNCRGPASARSTAACDRCGTSLDHNKASKPAATATTAGTLVAAAIPLALALVPEAAADAAELAELATLELTELAEAETELAALETDDEADDALDEADEAAEEEAADTAPKTPPSTESGWLLPLTDEAADLYCSRVCPDLSKRFGQHESRHGRA